MSKMNARLGAVLWGLALLLAGLTAQAGTITYFHNDLAGSPLVATNQDGHVIWRENYRPYGERLVNSAAASGNAVWFTSRRQDAESGLVYMGARHYDPVAGRFVSPDPVGFDEGNLHSFNRYAYANNNPYRYKDPDGRSPLGIFAFEVAKHTGAGYVIGVAADAISQGVAFGTVDWGMAATSSAAVAGGEAGLLAGAFVGVDTVRHATHAARSLVKFPDNAGQIGHIFRDAPGHIADTPANRQLISDVANNAASRLGTDRFGNVWSAMTRSDGTQVWVSARNGAIQNAGVNTTPRIFSDLTGP